MNKVSIEQMIRELYQNDNAVIEKLKNFHNNRTSDQIKTELSKQDEQTTKQIFSNLINIYKKITDKEIQLKDEDEVIVKNQIVYYSSKLPFIDNRSFLKEVYYHEPDLRIRRTAALVATALGQTDMELDYLLKMEPGSMEDIVNRSATLIYDEDREGDFYTYVDDNVSDWNNARSVRMNRLKEKSTKSLNLRLFDLKTLYCFFESRKWRSKLLKEELSVIENLVIGNQTTNHERTQEFNRVKKLLISKYIDILNKQQKEINTNVDHTVIETINYVQSRTGDSTGHDYYRTIRIMNLAKEILETEDYADSETVLLSLLLHDVDKAITGNKELDYKQTKDFLRSIGVDANKISAIIYIIENVENKYHLNAITSLDINGKIVQDAYRLDSMGAIAIARAISSGTKQGRRLCDALDVISKEQQNSRKRSTGNTIISQVYQNVVSKNDFFNTRKAKEIAEIRHKAEEDYLKQFFAEWKGINYHEKGE